MATCTVSRKFTKQEPIEFFLTTSAGWCTACIEEQAALQTLYTDYAGRGVEILVTVFQKAITNPRMQASQNSGKEDTNSPTQSSRIHRL